MRLLKPSLLIMGLPRQVASGPIGPGLLPAASSLRIDRSWGCNHPQQLGYSPERHPSQGLDLSRHLDLSPDPDHPCSHRLWPGHRAAAGPLTADLPAGGLGATGPHPSGRLEHLPPPWPPRWLSSAAMASTGEVVQTVQNCSSFPAQHLPATPPLSDPLADQSSPDQPLTVQPLHEPSLYELPLHEPPWKEQPVNEQPSNEQLWNEQPCNDQRLAARAAALPAALPSALQRSVVKPSFVRPFMAQSIQQGPVAQAPGLAVLADRPLLAHPQIWPPPLSPTAIPRSLWRSGQALRGEPRQASVQRPWAGGWRSPHQAPSTRWPDRWSAINADGRGWSRARRRAAHAGFLHGCGRASLWLGRLASLMDASQAPGSLQAGLLRLCRLGAAALLLGPALASPALALPGAGAAISAAAVPAAAAPAALFDPARYTPAVLRLSFSSGAPAAPTAQAATATPTPTATPAATATASFLDLTLLPPSGDPIGKRLPVSSAEFAALLRDLYAQLSRQAPLDAANPQAPARLLYNLLIAPLAPDLERLGVTTLLVAADPGLQAVPLAALHDGRRFFGERYAFALTPSLGLTSLSVPASLPNARQIGAGASDFDGLAPLPLVPQELQRVAGSRGETYLNRSFTPSVLLDRLGDADVARVHVATHAEFLPGGPSKAKLFTGTEPFNLSRFAQLRQRRSGQPLDLIALSACRTALGDKDSELGFAGLALQAGARSAIGTLWYVDDVATSAFFVQFYRYLDAGLPKAEALQATRLAMANGRMRLQDNRVVGPDGDTLVDDLTATQQQRVREGLSHPFFWSGITLLGTPW